MKRGGVLQNNQVVGTVMTNLGIIKGLSDLGIELITSKVGDRYVIKEMIEYGCNLGGEQSGHMIFLDHNTTGDGLVTALQVLRIMIETDSKLSDLASKFKKYPQAILNVKVNKKPSLEKLKDIPKVVKGAEKELGDSGRVLVRYSGTEMICRVMVEGSKQKQVNQIARSIAEVVQQEIGVAD